LQNIKTGKHLTREIKWDSHKSMEENQLAKFPWATPLIKIGLKNEKTEKS